MPQYQPVNSTATVSLGVLSTALYDGTIPMLFKTVYSDQAVVSTTTISTNWGPMTVTTVSVTSVY